MKIFKRKEKEDVVPQIKGTSDGKLYWSGNFFDIPKVREMIIKLSNSDLVKKIDNDDNMRRD